MELINKCPYCEKVVKFTKQHNVEETIFYPINVITYWCPECHSDVTNNFEWEQDNTGVK